MSQAVHVSSASSPVEQVARLIRRFDHREKAQLVQLVPELRTVSRFATGCYLLSRSA